MNVFTESHYRPKFNGKPATKWSGRLPVNYGNEKTSKGKENIYSTDTVQGCTNNCVGCYAAKMSMIACKNFSIVKNVRLVGKPLSKDKPFIWTAGQHGIPKEIRLSNIGINITLDPMRSKAFFNKALRLILSLEPRRVLVGLKVYPGNPVSLKRCRQVAILLRSIGYKGIFHMVMRIRNKGTAKKLNCFHYKNGKKKEFYKRFAYRSLGIACGSLGDGLCKDCMLCYRYHNSSYRVGTMSDPMLRQKHTIKEFMRMGWL